MCIANTIHGVLYSGWEVFRNEINSKNWLYLHHVGVLKLNTAIRKVRWATIRLG